MGHIILPDKLSLIVCPSPHEGDARLRFGENKADSPRYFVIAFLLTQEGKEYTYFHPPVQMVIAQIEAFRERNGSVPLGILHKNCAECMGFETPDYWRKKYRERPIKLNPEDEYEGPDWNS